MKQPIPLLLISDAVSSTTGLGRITRDLAVRIHEHLGDVYRVGTYGIGGQGSRHLGFQQYHAESLDNWVLTGLPEVWEDFAGDEHGIVFTIWDASRLGWLSQPSIQCDNPLLKLFLMKPPFKKWGYFPIDAEGPNGKLPYPIQQVLAGFDRRLAYGKWAAEVVDRSLAMPEGTTDYLPHGIDSSVFYERNRRSARAFFPSRTGAIDLHGKQASIIQNNEILIGIVATNQSRKDWALGIETCAILAKNHNVRLWIHTDVYERNWSIPALIIDFGLVDRTVTSTGFLADDRMAQAYSACDITLGIGLGEGFGFPCMESLFCGTPCLHGDYAGAPEWMLGGHTHGYSRQEDEPLLVKPIAYRYEGIYSCKRPVFAAQDWADKAERLIGKRMNHNGEIDWNELWPRWCNWFREPRNE